MATKIATALFVFFIALNGMSWMLIESGGADALGIDATVGDVNDDCSEDICIQDPDEDQEDRGEVGLGGESGDTLFFLIQAVVDSASGMFESLFPALAMFRRLGVPSYITAFLGTLFSSIVVWAAMSFARGYSL